MTPFELKATLVDALCQQLQVPGFPEDKNLTLFVHHFFKRVPLDFLQKVGVSELVHIVREGWKLFQKRHSTESLVKIEEYQFSHQASPRQGIFMINLDQPFLIDSITAFFEKSGYKIEMIIHPVLSIHRTSSGHLVSLKNIKETNTNLDKQEKNSSVLPDLSEEDHQALKNFPPQVTSERGYHPESLAFILLKSSLKRKHYGNLEKSLHNLLDQIRSVVWDWPRIRHQIKTMDDHVSKLPLTDNLPPAEQRQNFKELMEWLVQGYFVFLGMRYFSLKQKENDQSNLMKESGIEHFEVDSVSLNLGLFHNETFSGNIDLAPALCSSRLIPPTDRTRVSQPFFYINKTNARSTVHRDSRIDSLEIIDWDKTGVPRGLYQFAGIFTQPAFTTSAFETPVVRHKVNAVFNQFGIAPEWHDGKTLITILNSIPRDELFYLQNEQIYEISQKVLNMNDQHFLTLSMRTDVYGRYISVMIFVSREKYSFTLKTRFKKILEHFLKGKISSDNVFLGELEYARLIFVMAFKQPDFRSCNVAELEAALQDATLSWEDHFERIINRHYDEHSSARLLLHYQNAFSQAYVEEFSPEQALVDIRYCETISDNAPIDLYLYQHKSPKSLKVKIFHARQSLSLSTLLPILQNLGLQINGETSYQLKKDGYAVWVHDFDVDAKGMSNWRANHANLITAFHHIWKGTVENDILHRLILKTGLKVNQICIIRAYLKYIRQLQVPSSLEYMQETLTHYAEITRCFVDLFETRFAVKRLPSCDSEEVRIRKNIHDLLDKVERLDHDRILRRVLNAIEATVRTNYFQTVSTDQNKPDDFKSCLSFKFDCHKLEDLPSPRPLYEIFLYSPRVEAIHLRGARVARGGIRLSERPEDFRTEVLSLMKAQTLKNAVIVPLGSKGGFVVKNQGKFTDSVHLKEEVVTCYQIMMQGLLELTDNLVKGRIVRPGQVRCLDDEDPYLVVAADKGTATFSDIANDISAQQGFWLDDAFASGGSAGYDHKKIGITARGVWESVKRHFREMGRDCQTSPFTVIGVGDMSGDVFGNGMIQSRKIQLLAAFNHTHIFLDPYPDMEKSFQERNRLFNFSECGWRDYNPKLISSGGGVYERSIKSITLNTQCRKIFNIQQQDISPDDLIRHLLCLPVDLLYFGGIGTFIKASTETHSDAGDRENNDVRVDAKSVGAKVIGEGANLGMTQRGRIEYALNGGRLNTDGIDNSAGVDCSDHEVNLKILFKTLGHSVTREHRNNFLKQMTDELAGLVLRDNYRQTQTLTVLESAKSSSINIYQSLMRILETEAGLDRILEALPDDDVLERRRARNQGMTRPELAVLLGYSKIFLHQKLLGSVIPDDPSYKRWLHEYFPVLVQKKFPEAIDNHPLRREIIATVLANEIINRTGPAFIYDIAQTSGMSETSVVKSFFLACEALDLADIWNEIDKFDDLMITDMQTHILLDISQCLEQAVLWFLRHPQAKQSDFRHIHKLQTHIPELLHGNQLHFLDKRKHDFIQKGISPDVALALALVPYYPYFLDILFLSEKKQFSLAITQTYFNVRVKLGLDDLMMEVTRIHGDTDWKRNARTSLMDDITQILAKQTFNVLREGQVNNMEAWLDKHRESMARLGPILATIKSSSHPDLGILSYTVRQLQRLL